MHMISAQIFLGHLTLEPDAMLWGSPDRIEDV